MKWVTRERPKIDRIACPWLVKKFVDPEAEFLYVPKNEVLKIADEQDAIPYDVPGVELTHFGPYCSFDAIIKKYKIVDPSVLALAEIVRAADTNTRRRRQVCWRSQKAFPLTSPTITKCSKWDW
jgi:hypothetical protein